MKTRKVNCDRVLLAKSITLRILPYSQTVLRSRHTLLSPASFDFSLARSFARSLAHLFVTLQHAHLLGNWLGQRHNDTTTQREQRAQRTQRTQQRQYNDIATAQPHYRTTTQRRHDDTTTQRHNDTTTTRRHDDTTTQRHNDDTATTQRRHNDDTTTQRRNDATTQRRDETSSVQRPLSPQMPLTNAETVAPRYYTDHK